MGPSKSNRVRNSAAQIEPETISPSLTYALRFSAANLWVLQTAAKNIQQAVRLGVWLQGMQKQLQKTAVALRDNPSSVLSRFQKTFSRPSYFFRSHESGDWTLLLGPQFKTRATAPALKEVSSPKIFDFVVEQPRWTAPILRLLRGLHQWLMHPMIDIRPDEPA